MTTNTDNGMNCTVICWIVAAIAAILLFLILTGIGMGTFLAVILTLIAFAFGGWWAANNFCSAARAGTQPAPAATTAAPAAVAPAANPEAAAEAAPAAEPVAEAEPEAVAPEPTPEPVSEEPTAVEPAPAPAAAAPAMKSTLLAGESELASRKGTWRYEAGAAAAPAAAASEDYDGDGVLEGTDEGEKPSTMAAPREGGGDDLKQIKGVGPKMQDMLNGMGFWHFDQIAAWTDQEVAWVDANLEGFKGRVSRDGWVEQAKILAAGGETEFSKRVEDGDVY